MFGALRAGRERRETPRCSGRCQVSLDLVARTDSQEIARENPLDVLERLLNRGEMEVVTTSSGVLLYILQSLDE